MDAQKKTPAARERRRADVQEKRGLFILKQPDLNPNRLVFIDESGFRLGSPTRYGWSRRGEPLAGHHVCGAWTNMTMIGALALDGFRGFMTIESGTSSDVFFAFVEQQLTQRLQPDDIVVMDNLQAHKNPEVLNKIRSVGASTLFLPPYSPEWNPIERAWSKMKELIRRFETLTRETFDHAVATAMNAVTQDNIMAWVRHAGYAVSSM